MNGIDHLSSPPLPLSPLPRLSLSLSKSGYLRFGKRSILRPWFLPLSRSLTWPLIWPVRSLKLFIFSSDLFSVQFAQWLVNRNIPRLLSHVKARNHDGSFVFPLHHFSFFIVNFQAVVPLNLTIVSSPYVSKEEHEAREALFASHPIITEDYATLQGLNEQYRLVRNSLPF